MIIGSHLAGLRVLVVEDVFIIADELAHLLVDWGCEVVGPAPDLVSASHLSDEHEIDFALLDVNLRGERVFPIAHKLLVRNVPFVFLTAYTEPSAFPPEFQAAPRLPKPVAPTTLHSAMAKTFVERSLVNSDLAGTLDSAMNAEKS